MLYQIQSQHLDGVARSWYYSCVLSCGSFQNIELEFSNHLACSYSFNDNMQAGINK